MTITPVPEPDAIVHFYNMAAGAAGWLRRRRHAATHIGRFKVDTRDEALRGGTTTLRLSLDTQEFS